MRVHPGTTAHGVADAASVPFPAHGDALRSAAADFDAVRYLGRVGLARALRGAHALEAELAAATPAREPADEVPA